MPTADGSTDGSTGGAMAATGGSGGLTTGGKSGGGAPGSGGLPGVDSGNGSTGGATGGTGSGADASTDAATGGATGSGGTTADAATGGATSSGGTGGTTTDAAAGGATSSGGGGGTAPDAAPDGGTASGGTGGGPTADASLDAAQDARPDASVDATIDGASDGSADAGLVGATCKALLASHPGLPSGVYAINPLGTGAHAAYCDMTTDGGGWTEVVYPAASDAEAMAILGASGKQLLKCSEAGAEFIESPSITDWSWAPSGFVQVAGNWLVDGVLQACGANPEFVSLQCSTWFGVGCGNGPGGQNKVFPGVSDASGGTCADRTTAHTNGAFTICGGSGPSNYGGWVTFLRED